MLMVDVWRLRFHKALGWFGWLLLAAGVVRMVVMVFPNQWGRCAAGAWGLFATHLVVQGLGVVA
jgi:hypothetical protein